MDANVVDCDLAEREQGVCMCKEGGSNLDILKQVQRAYEDRLEVVERIGGQKKLQMQVDVLRSFVGDLEGQNALLARAVQELEAEATTRLLMERTKHAEMEVELRTELSALRRRLARKDADLRGLVEVLRRLREFDYCTLEGIHFFEVTESDIFGTVQWRQKKLEEGDVKRNTRQDTGRTKNNRHHKREKKKKPPSNVKDLIALNDSLRKENLAKEREIIRLNKDVHQYEQTLINLRSEMSLHNYHTRDASKKDAEVMAGMCCTGNSRTECGAVEVNYGTMLKEDAVKYKERISKMEGSLKSTGENVRALRMVNVALSEELHALRRVCAALEEQCRASTLGSKFKDDIIHEMQHLLKQAKAKLKESEISDKSQKEYGKTDHKLIGPDSYGAITIACVRQQPRRKRALHAIHTSHAMHASHMIQPSHAMQTSHAMQASHAIQASHATDSPLHPDSDDCRTPRFDGSGVNISIGPD